MLTYLSSLQKTERREGWVRVHNYGATVVTDKAVYNTNGSVIRQTGRHLNGQT